MNQSLTLQTMRISPRLFFFIGSGIFYADSHYPYPLMAVAGRDSWLVTLIGGMSAVLLIGWLGTRVIRYLPKSVSSLETFPHHPGITVWQGVHLLTAFWAWGIAAWSLLRFSEFVQNNMMPMTPLSVFLIGLLFITAWGGLYGIEAGGRAITISALLIFLLPPILTVLMLRQAHLQWLLPIAQESQFFTGCLISLSFFFQAAPLCLLFHLVEDRQKAFRALLTGLSISILLATAVRALAITVINPYLAPYYNAPDYVTVRLIQLTEDIDRVELPLIWLWAYGSWAKILVYLLLGTFALLIAFRSRRWVSAHLVSSGMFVILTILGVTIRPDGFATINWLEMKYIYYINLGFQMASLAIITLLALIRQMRKKPTTGKAKPTR